MDVTHSRFLRTNAQVWPGSFLQSGRRQPLACLPDPHFAALTKLRLSVLRVAPLQVLAAVEFAAEVHGSQRRKTGEPYVTHCIETALIVEACLPPAASEAEQQRCGRLGREGREGEEAWGRKHVPGTRAQPLPARSCAPQARQLHRYGAAAW